MFHFSLSLLHLIINEINNGKPNDQPHRMHVLDEYTIEDDYDIVKSSSIVTI
jgi:hypothetical protein